ncbi:unnamed protein product [Ambrosiozyma monospora]|uniref:Unnamed protein product n=1 Tax=Ambrosiozyma monospora TaxID=43982 RepID=A0ACB5T4I1_AMBMO|nr:unnamed protein product [Ambrosiozyma monospora]
MNHDVAENVPLDTTEEQIRELCSPFGSLRGYSVEQDNKFRKSFKARVEFLNGKDANECAKNSHGFKLRDHFLMTKIDDEETS